MGKYALEDAETLPDIKPRRSEMRQLIEDFMASSKTRIRIVTKAKTVVASEEEAKAVQRKRAYSAFNGAKYHLKNMGLWENGTRLFIQDWQVYLEKV